MQYSPILHVVIRMRSSNHAHSDHEQQLAKIMAEVGSSTSSPGVSLQNGWTKILKLVKSH